MKEYEMKIDNDPEICVSGVLQEMRLISEGALFLLDADGPKLRCVLKTQKEYDCVETLDTLCIAMSELSKRIRKLQAEHLRMRRETNGA